MSPTFLSSAVSEHRYCVEPDPDAVVDRAHRTMELLRQVAGADVATAARLREEVVLLNIGVAETIAARYRNRGVPVEDLFQVACLGLVKPLNASIPTRATTSCATPSPPSSGK
jgi:RNA polymerase sigma-B factor